MSPIPNGFTKNTLACLFVAEPDFDFDTGVGMYVGTNPIFHNQRFWQR